MSQYDDDAGYEGPVVVRRPIHDAGMKLEADVKAGTHGPAFEIARRRAEEFREAGKADDARFWTEVYDFLMTRESVGAEVETIILEEGEVYDWNVGKIERRSLVMVFIERDLQRVAGLSIREAAMVLGVPASRVYGERTALLSRNHAYAFA